MKASELVEELRKLVVAHGDHEVLCDCGSIHASLASVGLAPETEEAGMRFVVYQREEEERRATDPDRAMRGPAVRRGVPG